MDHCKYSFNRCCEHVVLKVDVLETGKMGKREDLSEFDKGQIVMARWLGQSISCSDPCSELQLLLVVPSLQWSVSIRTGPRKKQWWTGNRVVGGQGSLMHVGSEGWPVWSDPTDELLMLKLLSNLMLVQIERLQNTKCITVCCVWGSVAAGQSGCPCWPLITFESTNNGHVSIRTGPRSYGRWWPGPMNHVGQTSPIHGGPTSLLTGLKGSAAHVLMPDTRGG